MEAIEDKYFNYLAYFTLRAGMQIQFASHNPPSAY